MNTVRDKITGYSLLMVLGGLIALWRSIPALLFCVFGAVYVDYYTKFASESAERDYTLVYTIAIHVLAATAAWIWYRKQYQSKEWYQHLERFYVLVQSGFVALFLMLYIAVYLESTDLQRNASSISIVSIFMLGVECAAICVFALFALIDEIAIVRKIQEFEKRGARRPLPKA